MTELVASDIDGTLLRSDGTVSDRSREAIAALEAADGIFVLVTGRPPRWLAPITEQVDHRGLAICANGGILMDLHTDEVIDARTFPDGLGSEVLRRLRGMEPELAFGVEWVDGFAHEATYPRGVRKSELARGAAHDVDDVEELFARPVVKLLARVPGEDELDGLAQRAVDELGGMATVTWSSLRLLEVSAPGVTKATALERFVAEHDIAAADVVAIGDAPNDLAMLRWAGTGVAVANAHPLVLEAADEVTGSNDEDGVAQVIERVLARAGA